MRSATYTALATAGFLVMFWLYDITSKPGTQWFAAFGLGVACAFTVRMIVRAGQQLAIEERGEAKVRAVRDGR